MAPLAAISPSRTVQQSGVGAPWLESSGVTKPVLAPLGPLHVAKGAAPWIYPGGGGQSEVNSVYETPLASRSRAELPPIVAEPGNHASAGSVKIALPGSPRPATGESLGNTVSDWLHELRQENIWVSDSGFHGSNDTSDAWQWLPQKIDVLNCAMPVVPPSLILRPIEPARRPWRTRRRSPNRKNQGELSAMSPESPRGRDKKGRSEEAVRSYLRKQGAGGKESKDDDFTSRPTSGDAEPDLDTAANAPKSFSKKGHRSSVLFASGDHSVIVSSGERENHGGRGARHARESTCRQSQVNREGRRQESTDALGRRDTSDTSVDALSGEESMPATTMRRRSWMGAPEDSEELETSGRPASKSILQSSLGEQVWKATDKRFTVKSKFHFKLDKPGKPKLSDRMKRLEVRRNERVKQIRCERQFEMKVRQFERMEEEEKAALKHAFATFDEDRSGYLDSIEVLNCLREFGLAGQTCEEKRAILDICSEATTLGNPFAEMTDDDDGSERKVAVDIYDLALMVVPEVRTKLLHLRGDELLRQFFKYDLDGSGKLSRQESLELARDMGLDPRMMMEGFRDEEEIDFELFQELVTKGQEALARIVRDRERACQRRMGLPEDAFLDFREDLVSLHDLFSRYDKDDSGTLSKVEMNFMLKEFGLSPTTPEEKTAIDAILRYNDKELLGEVTFAEFLEVIRQIRTLQQEQRREQQLERFLKYDKDKSGSLSHAEISMLLADLGFVPSTRKEQDELAYLISSVDADGSGLIEFPEFQVLCQRIDEKLKSFRYEEEVEFAMRLGFTEKQMRDLRWVFDSLDIDGSNKLDAAEVRNGLVMMRKHVSTESFEASFKALDKDGSGELDFTEFLSFMKMMRDGEGLSSEETQKLALKARNLDMRILRRVLEIFRLSRRYINSLSHDDLVNLFCEYFKIGPMTNMHEVLEVKTVGELYEAARVRDIRMQALES